MEAIASRLEAESVREAIELILITVYCIYVYYIYIYIDIDISL